MEIQKGLQNAGDGFILLQAVLPVRLAGRQLERRSGA